MNIFDLVLVIKNHLTDDECLRLIKEYERKKITAGKEQSFHAYEEKMTTSNFKRVEINESSDQYDLVKSKTESALNIWLAYLQEKKSFNIPILRSVLQYPYSFRILKYEAGSYIHPHTDWDHFNYASVTLNLNQSYTGGEFVFMNGKHKINLEKGDALVFPTDHYWVHETYPILSGNRYSVNTFISNVHSNDRNIISKEIYKSQQGHDRIFKL